MRGESVSSLDGAAPAAHRERGSDAHAGATHVTRRRNGFVEIAWVLAILLTGNLVGAALVFAWAALTRTPLAALGFVRPRSIVRTVVFATLGGVALKLVLKAAIMPALGFDAINATYHYVTGNRSALWRMLLFVI